MTPYLIVDGATGAIEFYKKAFGARELMRLAAPGGKVGHAKIWIGDFPDHAGRRASGHIGARGPKTFGGSPVSLHLYVEDVDAATQAIATESASFAWTEVRWGVIPEPIIPQLSAAMGERNLRRYGVTGERFDAPEAKRISLVHEVCPDDALDRAAAPIIDAVLKSAPDAVRASKRLVLAQAGLHLTEQQVEALALQAAVKRASAEAADGLASFLDRRDPPWCPPD